MLTLSEVRVALGAFSLSADIMVPEQARVAVIGASGSGKSTLLNVIAGFQALDQGRIEIAGRRIDELAPGARPLSVLFQDSNLFPHLTVAQNVGLGIRPNLRMSSEELERVDAALARTGLAGFETRKPSALSGGQQSRVALARVLLRQRPLLLLDEPFAALGPALRQEMLELVNEIATQDELTVMMVTHEPADARALADLCVFVDAGQVNAPVPTADLLDNPPQALKDYLGK